MNKPVTVADIEQLEADHADEKRIVQIHQAKLAEAGYTWSLEDDGSEPDADEVPFP